MAEVAERRLIEEEPPELAGRTLVVSSWLLASASAFFFLAFVFAYFYLRSLNNSGQFQPKGVDPSIALGTLVTVAAVAAAVLVRLGRADETRWRGAGLGALALGLLAVVLQVVAWFTEGFGPASGGYASVYIGWTAFYALFLVVALYWLETSVVTAIRSGSTPRDAAEREALAFYWAFLALVGVLAWIVLYLI